MTSGFIQRSWLSDGFASRALSAGRSLAGRLRSYAPSVRRAAKQNAHWRDEGLKLLADWSQVEAGCEAIGDILVDGQWDNANYWIRYAILRRALGLHGGHETCLIGAHNAARVSVACERMGLKSRRSFDPGQRRDRHLDNAQTLMQRLRSPDQVLELQLPDDMPAALLYDGILKRQRRAVVDLRDPNLPKIVAEALAAIEMAVEIVEEKRWSLVVLSHAVDFTYGALAWAALRRNIPVIVLYGDYGTTRFMHLGSTADLFCTPVRPTAADDRAASDTLRTSLSAAGGAYMANRLGGQTNDVGAIYAYQRRNAQIDRQSMCVELGWDPADPIVAVYSPNWFDYPHSSDRMPFRDFMQWAQDVHQAALQSTGVNFLFKAHPCDEWYGTIRGQRLADVLAATPAKHCRMADTQWNGRAIFGAIDALTTFHGTAGLEAAMLRMPLLLPYSGWYADFGIGRVAESRAHYLELIRTKWWTECDLEGAAEAAERFVGWYFCVPAWHGDFIFHDDANQDAIWWDLGEFLSTQESCLMKEIDLVREWMADGHLYFHIFKLLRSGEAKPPATKPASAIDPRLRQLRRVGLRLSLQRVRTTSGLL